MTSKRLVLVLAAAVVASACGGVARPESRSSQTDPTVVEPSITSVGGERTATTLVSPASMASGQPPEMDEAESSPSTTTADTADGPVTTTTNHAESIDLAEVRDALDAIAALLGDLDSQIGSVQLDEGETP